MKKYLYSIILLVFVLNKAQAADTLKVNFTAPLKNCKRKAIQFNNTTYSNRNIVSYFWDFGDGITSTDASPKISLYFNGNLKIKLVATTDNGIVDSAIKTIKIGGSDVYFISKDSFCSGESIEVTNATPNTKWQQSFFWNWQKDSSTTENPKNIFFYSDDTARQFNIVFVVSDTLGCIDSFIKKALVKPNHHFPDFDVIATDNKCLRSGALLRILLKNAAGKFGKQPNSIVEYYYGDNTADLDSTHIYYNTTDRNFYITVQQKTPGYCDYRTSKFVFIPSAVFTEIYWEKVTVGTKNYFRAYPGINGRKVNPLPNNCSWKVKQSNTDTLYSSNNYIDIPDTFTSQHGLFISLEIGGCFSSVYNIHNFCGIGTTFIRVYNDANDNENWDTGEELINNVNLTLKNKKQSLHFFLDSGARNINIFEKDTYKIEVARYNLYGFYKSNVITKHLNLGNNTLNIPFRKAYLKDAQVMLLGTQAMSRGFESKQQIFVYNNSNNSLSNVKIKLNIHKALKFITSDVAWTKIDSNQFEFTIPKILSDDYSFIGFTVLPDTQFNHNNDKRWITTTLVINDSVLDNNYDSLPIYIITPHDPNNKIQKPIFNKNGKIEKIIYRIEFENEGTGLARNVVLRDSLSPLLDINSISIIEASHEGLTINSENNKVLEFKFSNINLTPKSYNKNYSQGFVIFSINLKKELPFSDSVLNRVGIYFDFENVVMTDYAVTKYDPTLKIKTNYNSTKLTAFPNPASSELFVQAPSIPQNLHIRIIDLNGKTIFEKNWNALQNLKINTKTFSSGIYFLQITNSSGVKDCKKIIIQQ